MKKRKFCLLLAMLLVFAMAWPVQAAEPDSSGSSAPYRGEMVSDEDEILSERSYTVSDGDSRPDGSGTVSGGDSRPGGDGTVSGGDFRPGGDGSVSGGDAEDPKEDLSGKTVNLALVIDTTGSMYSYIYNVVENLSEFVRFIESTGVSFRLSMVDYRDITCGEETVVHTFDHSVWSQSTEQIIAEMQSLYVNGGGDNPETLIDALGYLVDESVMTFNSDAAKFAIVLTDAEYKIDNTHAIESMEEMITALQAKGIRVSVMTNSYCYSVYEPLTTATGGILCPVDDFAEALREYAMSIIKAAADTEVDDSIRPVTGIAAEGPTAVKPNYVYTYNVSFTPSNATDKGVYWYTEDNSVAEVLSAGGTTCYVRGVAEGNTKLVAVSKDGGYTSSIDVTVSNSAPVSDSILAYEYDVIREALGEDGVKTYEYHVTDGTMVTGEQQQEIFSGIRGKDKSFTFVFADESSSEVYKWNFLGTKITDEKQTLDFGIMPDAGNEDVLGAVKEDVAKMDIHFNHSGSLPGEASVTISVKDIFTTDRLHLYYYNAATGMLELSAEGVPVISGYATFPLTHCSDYILTAEMLRSLVPDVKPDNGNTDNTSSSEPISADTAKPEIVRAPKTGDDVPAAVFVIFLLSLTGMVFFSKKLFSVK